MRSFRVSSRAVEAGGISFALLAGAGLTGAGCHRNAADRSQDAGVVSVVEPRGDSDARAADAHPAAAVDAFAQLSVAGDHGCLATERGRLSCWGYGGHGALGFPLAWRGPDFGVCRSPTRVPGLNDVAQVTTALGRTCVRGHRGWVACFGIDDGAAPTTLEGHDAIDLALGPDALCVVDSGGGVRCSERTRRALRDASFRSIAGVTNGVSVAVGLHRACARTAAGEVLCWSLEDRQPAAVRVALPAPALEVAVTDDAACALVKGGAVLCWGQGSRGELGANRASHSRPVVVVPSSTPATQVRDGRHHVCALGDHGTVACWGDIAWAGSDRCVVRTPRGVKAVRCSRSPLAIPDLRDAKAVAAITSLEGEGGACVLRADGGVRCAGVQAARPTPGYPPGVLEPLVAAHDGSGTCATIADAGTAAAFPEGSVPLPLAADGRCLRDHERCPVPSAPAACPPGVDAVAVEALAEHGPALVATRVILQGRLTTAHVAVPDVFCGGDCCRSLRGSLVLTPAARGSDLDEGAFLELRQGPSSTPLVCSGDETLLCCPWALTGMDSVAGTLRRGPDRAGRPGYFLDGAAPCTLRERDGGVRQPARSP